MLFGRYSRRFQLRIVSARVSDQWPPEEGQILGVEPQRKCAIANCQNMQLQVTAKRSLCWHLVNTNEEQFHLLPNYFGFSCIPCECCVQGDVKSYMRSHRSDHDSIEKQGLLLNIACDMASGLQALHHSNFVHRCAAFCCLLLMSVFGQL